MLRNMEIRDSEIVKRYKEAKKFVQDYEQQYFLALVSASTVISITLKLQNK